MRFRTFMEADTPKLNMSYEIPYLAGYSKDGETIYIDKRINPVLILSDGRKMDVIPYLMRHESVEKHLIDAKKYKYQYAHEKATGAEREKVEADGFPWNEYQKYVLGEYKRLKELSQNAKVPVDLDIKPEIDTHDTAELSFIKSHQK